jgi:hypothetical protein
MYAKISMMLILRLLVICSALLMAVAFTNGATAARAMLGEEGVLIVDVSFSPDRDNELQPADCHIYVYSDLSNTRLPAGTTSPRDTRLPVVTSGPTERDGIAEFTLAAGSYTVAVDNCQHDRDARGQGLTTGYTGRPCCWHPDGEPDIKILRDELGEPSFVAQHVQVAAGETSTALFKDWGEEVPPSRRTVWLIAGLVLVIVLCGAALGSWMRGRYMPSSNPVNPKRYEPPSDEGERKPATFEDVFQKRD